MTISEAEAGSEADAMQTTARQDGDSDITSGQKLRVTKADVANAFLVYAKIDDGNVGAVVVDADAPGFSRGEESENVAGHVQRELVFDDCKVPAKHVPARRKEPFKELLVTSVLNGVTTR